MWFLCELSYMVSYIIQKFWKSICATTLQQPFLWFTPFFKFVEVFDLNNSWVSANPPTLLNHCALKLSFIWDSALSGQLNSQELEMYVSSRRTLKLLKKTLGFASPLFIFSNMTQKKPQGYISWVCSNKSSFFSQTRKENSNPKKRKRELYLRLKRLLLT